MHNDFEIDLTDAKLVVFFDGAWLTTWQAGEPRTLFVTRGEWKVLSLLHKAAADYEGKITFPSAGGGGGYMLLQPYTTALYLHGKIYACTKSTWDCMMQAYLLWEKIDTTPTIVLDAILNGVTDIGQLSGDDLRNLRKAVKAGLLIKYKGGPFPVDKDCYQANWFSQERTP